MTMEQLIYAFTLKLSAELYSVRVATGAHPLCNFKKM